MNAPTPQLFKTTMCRFHETRVCRYATSCPFAHSECELMQKPDLTKTSLCCAWQAHRCPLSSSECPFAHGRRELRRTTAWQHGRFPQPANPQEHQTDDETHPYLAECDAKTIRKSEVDDTDCPESTSNSDTNTGSEVNTTSPEQSTKDFREKDCSTIRMGPVNTRPKSNRRVSRAVAEAAWERFRKRRGLVAKFANHDRDCFMQQMGWAMPAMPASRTVSSCLAWDPIDDKQITTEIVAGTSQETPVCSDFANGGFTNGNFMLVAAPFILVPVTSVYLMPSPPQSHPMMEHDDGLSESGSADSWR